MAEDDQTEEAEEKLDASYKPDVATLGGDDADFARALGFGADDDGGDTLTASDAGDTPAPAAEEAPEEPPEEDEADGPAEASADEDGPTEDADEPEEVAAAADEDAGDDAGSDEDDAPPPVEAAAEDDSNDSDDAEESDDVAAAADEDEDDWGASPDDDDASAAGDPDEDAGDGIEYEDIHPRPAAEGIQETLLARADALMERKDSAPPTDAASVPAVSAEQVAALEGVRGELEQTRSDLSDRDRALAAALADLDTTHAELAATRAELEDGSAVDEKELEEIRVELETTAIERDQLIDQLAATSGRLVQSQHRGEQLEASLKAARGALIPLPEGERALRAEVIGLRGRLDEAAQENVRLTGEVASVATELSIAAPRVEDKQHEIDYHAERARDLEGELGEKDEQLDQAIGRHREAVGLATRLQAENNELRSTQAALEETLQARDLEITAREEHLRVTRDGLATRDTQMVDVTEQLEQERHRIEALEADLERAAIERDVLADKVARRESRIATLTSTLGRIEEAMGQRLQLAMPNQPTLAQAEWTRPAATDSLGAERAPRGDGEGSESTPPATEPAGAETSVSEPIPAPVEPVDECTPEPAESEPETAELEPAAEAPVVEDDPPAPEPEPEPEPEDASLESVVYADEDVDHCDPITEVFAEPSVEQAPAIDDAASDAYTFGTEAEADPEETPDASPNPGLPAAPAFPPILGRWRDRCFGEIEAAGGESVADFLAARLQSHLGDPSPEAVYLRSVGGSLPDAEARLVGALVARGVGGIRMDVIDGDDATADARRRCIELAGLGDAVDVRVGRLDDWADDGCHGILLADALHAQASPEAMLDALAPAIDHGALLLFTGRIAAGPVQLSASTLMRLEELWQFLPEPLATSDGLGTPPFRGDDGGCPAIHADLARVLCDRFAPVALAGFGHLADLVVGPNRGFALSDEQADALQLLESVLAIDESRALTESLPPRHGVGAFARTSAGPTEVYGLGWPCLDPA